ncbi:MAG: hypothetical protein JSS02_29890 [Planctomycetes bacterium]|nr:hypothetical protein [Planctomycetota bacterium]
MTVVKRISFSATLIGLLLVSAGCRQEPSRWEAAQKATEGKKTSVSQDAVDGSIFNQFFPPQGDGYDIVFKQEKSGFAQAALEQNGKEIAVFSVFDTASDPDAKTKFAESTEQVDGYPVVIEEKSLSALVGDRYQVQVRSTDPAFGKSMRAEWLTKFNLKRIAEIEN